MDQFSRNDRHWHVFALSYLWLNEVSEGFIPRIPNSLLPDNIVENIRVWERHPDEVSFYLSVLDKFTIEDEFVTGMRGAQVKIYRNGLERVGDLIALSPSAIGEKCDLSPPEVHRLQKTLGKLGVALGSDTSIWRQYRETVPNDFRLLVPSHIRLPHIGSSPRVP